MFKINVQHVNAYIDALSIPFLENYKKMKQFLKVFMVDIKFE